MTANTEDEATPSHCSLPLQRGLVADGKTYILDGEGKVVAITRGIFHSNDADLFVRSVNNAAQVDALVGAVDALLKAERCPNCPDEGQYMDGPTDDPEQVQCEWCECTESSLFKAKAIAVAAIAKVEATK